MLLFYSTFMMNYDLVSNVDQSHWTRITDLASSFTAIFPKPKNDIEKPGGKHVNEP